ncbi:MAG: hypothetical protein ACREQA_19820 [Candidatus Binatia bacterium]
MHRRQTFFGTLARAGVEYMVNREKSENNWKRVFFEVAGLTALSLAAGMVTLPLGIAAGGISCFVLSRMV